MLIRGRGWTAAAAAWVLGAIGASAATPRASALDGAIQVLADLTAIDTDCRDLAVNFGIGFRYARSGGLPPASIMPTGSRRAAFETALDATRTGYGAEIVCGALAHHYSVALPGSVTFPPPGRSGS